MSDKKAVERLHKTIGDLQDLIVELSGSLTDEGDDWSVNGLHNMRVRAANALPPGKRPDWLHKYADPLLLQS